MPKIHYPDNFKIEVVKHYKMHRNIGATLEKYGIAVARCLNGKRNTKKTTFFVFQRNLPIPVTKPNHTLIS